MALVQGINHVAVVTADLDRFAAFYCGIFEAELVDVDEAPFGRVAIIRLGRGTAMNVFEVADSKHAAGLPTMFGRGHIDHFGIDVIDSESFWRLRERLVAGGHSTGEVIDFGPVIGFDFSDPDGMTCEVDLVLDPTLAGGHPPAPYDMARARRR